MIIITQLMEKDNRMMITGTTDGTARVIFVADRLDTMTLSDILGIRCKSLYIFPEIISESRFFLNNIQRSRIVRDPHIYGCLFGSVCPETEISQVRYTSS